MNLRILFFLSFLCAQFSFAQQRLGIELGHHTSNLDFNMWHTTVHYQRVIKTNYLLCAGIFGGRYGYSDCYRSNPSGDVISSPIGPSFDTMMTNSQRYNLIDYEIRPRALGFQLGVGRFFDFDKHNGLRVNLYFKSGFSKSFFAGHYVAEDKTSDNKRTSFNHYFGAVSLEFAHTMAISRRLTWYYGLKLPYFWSMTPSSYSPQFKQDRFYKLEPQICVGITRAIGKCD